jgi:hypothetical protein
VQPPCDECKASCAAAMSTKGLLTDQTFAAEYLQQTTDRHCRWTSDPVSSRSTGDLRQVTRIGVLGLLGYALFAAGCLSILGTEFVAALVLPSIAHSAAGYVNDAIAAANYLTATGDIGLMQTAITFTGIVYHLAGGFIFGIALFRANVLARWAAALLAVGTVATIAIGVVPQYERLLALPTGIALVGLGYSLWRQRTPVARPGLGPVSSQLEPAGAQ